MSDPIPLLKARLEKAEAKVMRAEKTLESAKTEHSDLLIALRVMQELTGESPTPGQPGTSPNMAERQRVIASLLRVGRNNAAPPSELYESYRLLADEDISIDTFRTTIWRMKGEAFTINDDVWFVQGDNGLYWKEPATVETRNRHDAAAHANSGGFDVDDLDSDVPF